MKGGLLKEEYRIWGLIPLREGEAGLAMKGWVVDFDFQAKLGSQTWLEYSRLFLAAD